MGRSDFVAVLVPIRHACPFGPVVAQDATTEGAQRGAYPLDVLVAELGERAHVLPCNLSDPEAVADLPKRASEAMGGLDILVNNAGITRDNLFLRMKEEEWDMVIDVNLKGTYNCCKAAARKFLKNKNGARIINIASVIGVMGNAGQANYVASKAGLIGITKTAAKELAPRGITVNAIAPGFIETDMTASLPESVREAMLSQVPLGRPGEPEDVAAAVAFLVSEAAAYITGQVLHVSGGMYI